jgi:hypothetical protein
MQTFDQTQTPPAATDGVYFPTVYARGTTMSSNEYTEFLSQKAQEGADSGFDPLFIPDYLFDFQKTLVSWAIRKGRAALFVDTGLGKTAMQLVWAENVYRRTAKPVLILTPLAVSAQTLREADKFDIEARKSVKGEIHQGINITNYERLHYFDADKYSGVVCDESSILKSFDGSRRTEITQFMRKVPYRLLATATAAPNDFMELGTSSEALGYLGHMDMLSRFFINDNNNSASRRYGEMVKWRFKGHAELPFWRWICSWARAVRKPSDVGGDDSSFILPALTENLHEVKAREPRHDMLFDLPAMTLPEQRQERRRSLQERCEKVSKMVTGDNPALIWANLNDEADLIEKLVPDAVQISGSDSNQKKEESFLGFANGDIRVLVTKPKIGAWGLNFQHCNHVTFFPTHSFEQYYQGVRRCWRFGQKRPVQVDLIFTEGERQVLKNLQRKMKQSEEMFSRLVSEMNNAIIQKSRGSFDKKEEIPAWL